MYLSISTWAARLVPGYLPTNGGLETSVEPSIPIVEPSIKSRGLLPADRPSVIGGACEPRIATFSSPGGRQHTPVSVSMRRMFNSRGSILPTRREWPRIVVFVAVGCKSFQFRVLIGPFEFISGDSTELVFS